MKFFGWSFANAVIYSFVNSINRVIEKGDHIFWRRLLSKCISIYYILKDIWHINRLYFVMNSLSFGVLINKLLFPWGGIDWTEGITKVNTCLERRSSYSCNPFSLTSIAVLILIPLGPDILQIPLINVVFIYISYIKRLPSSTHIVKTII